MSVIGLRVGPFEIVRPASVPGVGDWYRARRTGMTRRQPEEVLVLLLPEDADGQARAALQTSFNNLRAVEDARIPAAVALYDGIGALAIDAPDGASLQDVIDARIKGTIALTPSTLMDLALEVAETLQHAHHRNRYHGHLEPSCVRITSTGKVFIFGFETPEARPSEVWQSPEHARREAVGPATDQWSLAAMLAGLIAGISPWKGHRAEDGDVAHLVDPIEQQWPALARLIRRMLEANPSNRHASMHPVRQELLALARKAGGTSERLELGRAMARRLGQPVLEEGTQVATQVLGVPGPDTSADTHVAPRAALPSEDAMDAPDAGLEPPPIVKQIAPEHREPTPLVDEPVTVVHPELEEVTQLRRPSDPIAVLPRRDRDEDEEEDVDVPTERLSKEQLARFLMNDGFVGNIDPNGDGFDLPDSFDDREQFASALAIAPGDGPTAVPYTDPGEGDSAIEVHPWSYVDELVAVADDVEEPLQRDLRTLDPVSRDHAPEPVELEGPTPTGGLAITRLVPVLVGVMVVLMVLSVLWSWS